MLKFVSKPLSLLIGVAAALVSYSAQALPVNVTYAMQYTFFSPAAGQNVLYGPGTLTLTFANASTPGLHVGPGPVHVFSGSAMLANTFTAGGGLLAFTGMQQAIFASGLGTVTAGGMFSLMTIGHLATGMLHCAGSCILAGFIASAPNNLTSGPRTINIAAAALLGFPSVGPQNFTAVGTGGMTPQGGAFAVTLTGQEVSRQVIPEPSTGLLLGLGLTGLGIATTSWRARRNRG
jgi:hypothetical protein